MHDARDLLAALHRAAVEGVEPLSRTREAVARWLAEHRDAVAACREAGGSVRIFAMGKAAVAMTAGGVRALHDHRLDPQHGIVVAASTSAEYASELPPDFVIVAGDHPVPGPASLRAADLLDSAVHDLRAGDIALVLLSGGTTALTAAPVAALSQAVGDADRAQAHIANLADTLLESGLAIHEMNAIRRRVLRFGAGRLAVGLAERGATHIPVFAISDVIGDDPAVIGSGPCSPDPLDDPTFLALLDAHDIRHRLERDTAVFLGIAGNGPVPHVPAASHEAFSRVRYELVARNRDAVQAMARAAERAGVTKVRVETEPLEGEAAPLGDRLARYAIACAKTLPLDESMLLAFGGEPVVNLRATYERAWDDDEVLDEALQQAIDTEGLAEEDPDWDVLRDPLRLPVTPEDEPMRGGRMQALALAASFALEEAAASGDPAVDTAAWRVGLLAAGTDGRDGPTDAAGAIVDAAVPALARRHGRRPERDLATGRSWFPLNVSDALLRTGQTGTNVMDVVAILIRAVR